MKFQNPYSISTRLPRCFDRCKPVSRRVQASSVDQLQCLLSQRKVVYLVTEIPYLRSASYIHRRLYRHRKRLKADVLDSRMHLCCSLNCTGRVLRTAIVHIQRSRSEKRIAGSRQLHHMANCHESRNRLRCVDRGFRCCIRCECHHTQFLRFLGRFLPRQ